MSDTSAGASKEWGGFRPIAYTLDPDRVWGLPLVRVEQTAEGKKESFPTTIGEIFAVFLRKQVKEDEVERLFGRMVLTAENCKVVATGPPFHRHLLSTLLDLQNEGINGFTVQWFWYDSDSRTDDAHLGYRFFLVDGTRIVREEVGFDEYPEGGFDPSIFTVEKTSEATWFKKAYWSEANVRFWFRKFYRETRIGQLMVLRPDEPELYYYPEGRWSPSMAFDITLTMLVKINNLLMWLLIVLGCIMVILLWK